MERTIKPEELQNLPDSKNLKVIDVRRKADFEAADSMLPGASWHDPAELANWSDTLPKDQEVVLYCMRGGAVSNEVVDTLQDKGIKARFIEGGINAWKEQGGKIKPK